MLLLEVLKVVVLIVVPVGLCDFHIASLRCYT